jgi:predicted metalloprotease with PDZ domain
MKPRIAAGGPLSTRTLSAQARAMLALPIRMMAVAAVLALPVGPARAASPGPAAAVAVPSLPVPQDRTYPGSIALSVDASDIQRRIVRVREHLAGLDADPVLFYPKWLPGTHAPVGPIDRLAGLTVSSTDGKPVPWTRDTVDTFAFHLHAPAGVHEVDLEFEYLSPTSTKIGRLEMSSEILVLDWETVVLYPAGYFARQIPVAVSLQLPAGWKFASALEPASADGDRIVFKPVDLEMLVDSPLFAGLHTKKLELDPGAKAPVTMDLFADRPELLQVKPEQLEQHRALVRQAYRLFGPGHYAHYDFLYGLSDQVAGKGLEHHQSSEDIDEPKGFVDWDKSEVDRDLLPHEFTHSWNGKFRRPADLWTPNYNVPMQDSLLWVYEGQTEYWGTMLTARSGLWSKQQALDRLALIAAYYQAEAGRRWRPLQDTTNEPIYNRGRPAPWGDWQRRADYYEEGTLLWLDADTLIRERSGGKRSLDDFARAFFGADGGGATVVTYTFDDVVSALGAVEPYDWAGFLRQRLDGVGQPAPLDGVHRGGYRLVFTDKPSDFQKDADARRKQTNLIYSIGVAIDNKDGTIAGALWNSPAFQAGLTENTQILAVNGIAYEAGVLTDAIRAAQSSKTPIQLIVKTGERYRVIALPYYDGLRYPHLERDPSVPVALLDNILAARAR